MAAEARSMLEDVGHAMKLSVVPSNGSSAGAPCHPYVAGEQSCSLMSSAHVSGTTGPYHLVNAVNNDGQHISFPVIY